MSKNLKITIAVAAGVAIVWGTFFGFYEISHADKVLAGVSAAGVDVAGLSEGEAKEKLSQKIDSFNNQNLELKSGDQVWIVKPGDLGISIVLEDTVNKALYRGRDQAWYQNLWQKTQSVFRDSDITAVVIIDEEPLDHFIAEHLGDLETPAHNASLKIKNSLVIETDSQDGIIIDRDEFMQKLTRRARNLRSTPVQIPFTTAFPVIDQDDVASAKLAAVNLLSDGLTLNHHDQSWVFPRTNIAEFISFEPRSKSGQELKDEDVYSKGSDKDNPDIILGVEFKGENFDKFIDSISEEVSHPPENARFKIVDEETLEPSLEGVKEASQIKGIELESLSQRGEELNKEATKETILNEVNHGETSVDIQVDVKNPVVTEENASEFGIKNLIARGVSNFSGSPRNRIHNIGVGADKFDSILIEQGETFSFDEILGSVDASTGYLQELVIKENDTIPEFGGGLCQVSTTMFRAVIDAGLPVTQRKNHAYAVQYYAPQGTDSTIYPPTVDLKFVNDTPGAILVQTKIEGKYLYFDFFGTYDDRIVEKTKPRTYGHFGTGGMKAKWGYTVKIDDVILTEDLFKSTYRPPSEFHKSDEEEKKKQEEEEKKKQEEEAKKKEAEEAKKNAEDDRSKAPNQPQPSPAPKPSPTPTPSPTPKKKN